jgi:hypothetical protein
VRGGDGCQLGRWARLVLGDNERRWQAAKAAPQRGRLDVHTVVGIVALTRIEKSRRPGVIIMSSDDKDVALLALALNHASGWFDAHVAQRQNLMGSFLVAVAFLSAGYVGALSQKLVGVAAVVCLVGAAVSLAFFLLDLRNRELTRASERPMKELQSRLANALELDSIRIIEAIESRVIVGFRMERLLDRCTPLRW